MLENALAKTQARKFSAVILRWNIAAMPVLGLSGKATWLVVMIRPHTNKVPPHSPKLIRQALVVDAWRRWRDARRASCGEEADMNLIQFEEHLVRVRSLRDALGPILICAQDLEEPSSAISTAIFLTDELRDALEQLEDSARAGLALSPGMVAAEIVGAPVQPDHS